LDPSARPEGCDGDPPDHREQIGAERDVGPTTALQDGEDLGEGVRDDVLGIRGGVRVLAGDRTSGSGVALVELSEGDRITAAHGSDEFGIAGDWAPDAVRTHPHAVTPVPWAARRIGALHLVYRLITIPG
jgi:hypothetical protein